MDRRTYLATAVGGALGLAGCTGSDSPGETSSPTSAGTATSTATEPSGTLTVATYGSFVDAPSSSPGPWLKEEFERRYPDATLEWATPESGINYYIQRFNADSALEADAYVGLKVPELVRVDQRTDGELFERPDLDSLSNWEHVTSRQFDERNRLLPVFTGYCSFVYDGTDVSEPSTLQELTTETYEGNVLVQNPTTDNTGLYFLLWTIKEFGPDGYRDYWRDLLANDVSVLDSWGSVYQSFTEDEVDVVTSYSNDRVYAERSDQNLEKHRVAFPGGHGYTNLSGMGTFAPSDQNRLAEAFLDFMLSPQAQGKLAELNVSFPVTDHASVPSVFEEYAKEPPNPQMYSYEELAGNLDEWLRGWERTVAES
ncbi:thiamine ABC transporter substrate-binding protein [Halobellus rufus]|uniref:thiamine ABC transporter substrate-binding protein n=1 Tax=Halobellus rufus TaxID=1448860 RepID=UPI0006795ADC|nr:thiamine ABC transporter substrate-binding protein [Halobellus rufus]